MKKSYIIPTMQWHRVHSDALLITVSTGADTPPLIADDSDGDASEGLVKSFEQKEWDW